MAFEVVTIAAGGIELRPQTIEIAIAHDEAARAFEAKVKHPDIPQAALIDLLARAPCTIRTRSGDEPFAPGGADLVLTGHVEKRSPRLQGEEQELTISGRSKTGDLVDSAADHATGEFRDKTAKDAIGDLAKAHGVTIESDVALKPRLLFRLRPAETVFAAAERWARAEGFTISDTPRGDLKFAKDAKKRHAGEIRDGSNLWPLLVDASAVHDDSKRFARVKVRAQAPDGYAPTRLRVEGEATDEGGGRNRLRVIVPPEAVAQEDARERARWHRDRAVGEGTTCEVKLVGWRDASGQLWQPGWNVFVAIAALGLAQDMTIKKVRLSQSDDGTFAALSLVDPRSFGGGKAKGGKSGKAWDAGKAGADDA
jgi:prophage tail gpP-like protein